MRTDANTTLSTLTAKQKAFVLAYVKHRNATRAAIEAGYSKRTARQVGSENLSKPYIQKAIQKLAAPALEEAQVSVDRIIKELAAIAFAPWREYMTVQCDDGEGVTYTKVNLSQKLRALDLLGEHLGMFKTQAPPQNEPSLELHWRPDLTPEETHRQLMAYLRRR